MGMPCNKDASLPNRNHLYVGASGSGKSQALKQNEEIPRAGARVLMYDPNEDHRASHYEDWVTFKKVAIAALKSGKGFRVAYSGGLGEADHEAFCKFCWFVLNGKKITYIIDEELSSSGSRSGKAAPWHARLLNQGRKYGMRYHGVVQFPTEVAKTVYRNCEIKYVGILELKAAKDMSIEVGVPWEEISNQVPLQFWKKDPSQSLEAVQFQMQYKENI